jgi:hypothetical protein
MENDELMEKWPTIKEKLKLQYPDLTDEELIYEIGKEGELQERLQKKLKKNWTEIRNILSLMG